MARNSDGRPRTRAKGLERGLQEACGNCLRPVEGAYSWKQIVVLPACIMGILAALSVTLVVILTRFYPY